MKYVFQCKIDGKHVASFYPWNRFKRGQFIKDTKDGNGITGTFDFSEANLYDDYSMIGELYDYFALVDLFLIVPVENGKLPTEMWDWFDGCITKSGKDEIVKLSINPIEYAKNWSKIKKGK